MHQIKHHHLSVTLFIVYIIGMTALMIWQGIGIAPDRYALILLLGSLLVKKTRAFLWVTYLIYPGSPPWLASNSRKVTTADNLSSV